MQQINTKKELIDSIEKCLSGNYLGPEDSRRRLCESFKMRVTDILAFFDDDYTLPAHNFRFEPDFCNFVACCDEENKYIELKKRFDSMCTALRTWVESRKPSVNQQRISYIKEPIVKHYSKISDVLFWVTIIIVSILLVGAVTLAVIQWATPKEEREKFLLDYATIIGVFDGIIGWIGFTVERFSDRKKNDVIFAADEAIRQNSEEATKHFVKTTEMITKRDVRVFIKTTKKVNNCFLFSIGNTVDQSETYNGDNTSKESKELLDWLDSWLK